MGSKESDLIIQLAEKQLKRLNDSLISFHQTMELEDSLLNDNMDFYDMPMINSYSLPEFDNVFDFGFDESRNFQRYPDSNGKILKNADTKTFEKHKSKKKDEVWPSRGITTMPKSSPKVNTTSHNSLTSLKYPQSTNQSNKLISTKDGSNNSIRDWRHGLKLARDNLGPTKHHSNTSHHHHPYNQEIDVNIRKNSPRSKREQLSTFWEWDERKKPVKKNTTRPLKEYKEGMRICNSRKIPHENSSSSNNNLYNSRANTRSRSEIQRYIQERERRRQKEKAMLDKYNNERRSCVKSYSPTGFQLSTRKKIAPYDMSYKEKHRGKSVYEELNSEGFDYFEEESIVKKKKHDDFQSLNQSDPITNRNQRIKNGQIIIGGGTLDSGIETGDWTMQFSQQPPALKKRSTLKSKEKKIQLENGTGDDKNLLSELRYLAKQADTGNPQKKGRYYDLLHKMYQEKITAYDVDSSDDIDDPRDHMEEVQSQSSESDEMSHDSNHDPNLPLTATGDSSYIPKKSATSKHPKTDTPIQKNESFDEEENTSSLAIELKHALLEAQQQLNLPITQEESLEQLSHKISNAVHQFLKKKQELRNNERMKTPVIISPKIQHSDLIDPTDQSNLMIEQIHKPDSLEIKKNPNEEKTKTVLSTEMEATEIGISTNKENQNEPIQLTILESPEEFKETEINEKEDEKEIDIEDEELLDSIKSEEKDEDQEKEIEEDLMKTRIFLDAGDSPNESEKIKKIYDMNLKSIQTNEENIKSRKERAQMLINLTKEYKKEMEKVRQLEKQAFKLSKRILPEHDQQSHSLINMTNQNQINNLPPRHVIPPDGLDCESEQMGNLDTINSAMKPFSNTFSFNSGGVIKQRKISQSSDTDEPTISLVSELTSSLTDQSILDAQIMALRSELDKKKQLVSNLKRKQKDLKRERIHSKERALQKQIEICDDQVVKLQDNILELEQYQIGDKSSALSLSYSENERQSSSNKDSNKTYTQNNENGTDEDDDDDKTIKEDDIMQQSTCIEFNSKEKDLNQLEIKDKCAITNGNNEETNHFDYESNNGDLSYLDEDENKDDDNSKSINEQVEHNRNRRGTLDDLDDFIEGLPIDDQPIFLDISQQKPQSSEPQKSTTIIYNNNDNNLTDNKQLNDDKSIIEDIEILDKSNTTNTTSDEEFIKDENESKQEKFEGGSLQKLDDESTHLQQQQQQQHEEKLDEDSLQQQQQQHEETLEEDSLQQQLQHKEKLGEVSLQQQLQHEETLEEDSLQNVDEEYKHLQQQEKKLEEDYLQHQQQQLQHEEILEDSLQNVDGESTHIQQQQQQLHHEKTLEDSIHIQQQDEEKLKEDSLQQIFDEEIKETQQVKYEDDKSTQVQQQPQEKVDKITTTSDDEITPPKIDKTTSMSDEKKEEESDESTEEPSMIEHLIDNDDEEEIDEDSLELSMRRNHVITNEQFENDAEDHKIDEEPKIPPRKSKCLVTRNKLGDINSKEEEIQEIIDELINGLLDNEIEFYKNNILNGEEEPEEKIELNNMNESIKESNNQQFNQINVMPDLGDRPKWYLSLNKEAVMPIINDSINTLYIASGLSSRGDESIINRIDEIIKCINLEMNHFTLFHNPQIDPVTEDTSTLTKPPLVDKRAITLLVKDIFLNIYSPHRIAHDRPWIHPSAAMRCRNHALWKSQSPPNNKEVLEEIVISEINSLLERFFEPPSLTTTPIAMLGGGFSSRRSSISCCALESPRCTKQLPKMIKWCLNQQRDDIDRLLVHEMRLEDSDWIFYDEAEEEVKLQVATDIFNMLINDTVSWLRNSNDIYISTDNS